MRPSLIWLPTCLSALMSVLSLALHLLLFCGPLKHARVSSLPSACNNLPLETHRFTLFPSLGIYPNITFKVRILCRHMVAKGEWSGGGMDWKSRVSRHKLLYLERRNNKV